ncbi:BTAD domain-containing putative transcriptional regulator [Kitasatospora sp. MAP5-34]|uniref:BTAD domain-containing putative transcriptional regulator n=1 Tax=Kitasatospora sp. MAP5-34 TaxID=3035102 RepID=UPI00247397F5|nr:BTAD domain-containing putative transcriptional regulator [Kitasatospora sp. MAP5-34]MDH6578744.1 DNA-binding SARP family transcriptional activator [Kitasatospora sp. MAP5-34]
MMLEHVAVRHAAVHHVAKTHPAGVGAAPAGAQESGTIRFRILGELSVEIAGRPLPLGPVKQRLVLAILLCRPNTTVSTDLLTEVVWGDDPPRSARKNLQAYVSALRKLLALADCQDRLVHQPSGYVLRVEPGELDLLRFDELTRAGRQAARLGAGAHAVRLLREALDLWSGPLLADLACSEVVREEAERYATRRLAVHEDWAEAELELGHAPAVADVLAEVVREHPLRERLCTAWMTALYRAGRQTEALAAYDSLRQLLARQLGLKVSPALEAVYQAMLDGRDSGQGPRGGREGAEAARGPDRPRTVLPADLPDFTGRWDQASELREVLAAGGRTVVLSGPVGVGKTTLAVHVAHGLEQQFPDGRLTVRLRREDGSPRHPSSVLSELCRVTGLLGAVPEDEEEAAAVWRSWLTGRRVLVLLDDAPDEASIRHLLPGSGSGSVLITSRSRLAGLGPLHRLELAPYTTGEAVELLGRIVGDDRVPADRPAAERIVTAIGLLPLAVRVSGTKLAVLRQLTPAEYAARLEQSPSLLDELAAGDLAVRSRLAGWWCELPEVVRSVVRRLGHLPAPLFTLAEAANALGCSEVVACRVLESLIEVCVLSSPIGEVSAHAALYELPLLAQIYAREQADAARQSDPSGPA